MTVKLIINDITIEITDEEHLVLLEVQDVLGHKTLDETITVILKDYIEKNWANTPEEVGDDRKTL